MKTLITLMALTLTTASASSAAGVTPFTFAHMSDTHIADTPSHDANLKRAVDEWNAMDPRPAFVIHTGDITEMGQEEQFARYEQDIAAAKMPVHNTPGNHETRWADKSINRFAEHYGSPNISFLHNGVRFIGFNAAIWLEHHGAVSGDTRRWIVEQLKKDPKGTPAVLFCHQSPMYPDNVYITGDVELWDAIAPYNVRAFLNGHGHIFKSWTVNGVFCHMTKGMMNDGGGYTLYEVGTDAIRVYDKLNGEEKTLVATLPLHDTPVGVRVSKVKAGAYQAAVSANGRKIARVEWAVDYHQNPDDKFWKPLDATGPGRFSFPLDSAELSPGRHTLAVRAVDADGGVWISKCLPVDGAASSLKAARMDLGTALQGPAAVDGSVAYVGGWDGKLYAVALKGGALKKQWAFATGGAVIGRPDFDERAVYFGSTDESVYAVDKRTGKQIWKFATHGPVQGHTLAAGGSVYVGSGDHSLYALDAGTGKQRWAFPMGLHMQSRPVFADGFVYAGSWDGKVYAIDAATGEGKWAYSVSKSLFFASAVATPLVADGKVIVTRSCAPTETDGAHVLCLNAQTGEKVWAYHLPSGSPAYSSPTTDGKSVFLCTLGGKLFTLGLADGKPGWESQMSEIAYDCSPVYTDGKVICNTLLGSLEAHDAATGAKLWSWKTGGGLTFAWPTVSNGVTWLPSFDGSLTAVRP
ncbi:MAG TPA: PQQ-binding-like beta-propeller repeat protein [Armatimonadota bacterium]|jgi:outer membrane protein assembly factor BamB